VPQDGPDDDDEEATDNEGGVGSDAEAEEDEDDLRGLSSDEDEQADADIRNRVLAQFEKVPHSLHVFSFVARGMSLSMLWCPGSRPLASRSKRRPCAPQCADAICLGVHDPEQESEVRRALCISKVETRVDCFLPAAESCVPPRTRRVPVHSSGTFFGCF
jgi:hypothetical protein